MSCVISRNPPTPPCNTLSGHLTQAEQWVEAKEDRDAEVDDTVTEQNRQSYNGRGKKSRQRSVKDT